MKQIGILLLLVVSLKGTPRETKFEGLGKPSASFCAVMVPNAKESARWYAENLGFSEVRTLARPNGESRIITMEQEGAILEIIQVSDSFALKLRARGPGTDLKESKSLAF